jgi:hypothetical protein
MSNILLVLMFLFFTVPSYFLKQVFLSLAFCIYGSVFGFEEFLANNYTGMTVSQQVWQLIISKSNQGYKLLGFMLAGAICWVLHFYFQGAISIGLLISSFLFLAIPSMVYKQYFLTLASMIFILSVGFTDAISLQYTHLTVGDHLRELVFNHPIKGILELLSLLAGWVCLLLHLGIKFKKK